jgi:hypothetical protein
MTALWLAACATLAGLACGVGWWRLALLIALHIGTYSLFMAACSW